MASGKLGAADLAANTDTTLYAVPAEKVATVTVSFCNRAAAAVKVRLAASATGVPAAADYLEYDATVPANGVLERTGIVLGAGENLIARADVAAVTVRVHGFEEVA